MRLKEGYERSHYGQLLEQLTVREVDACAFCLCVTTPESHLYRCADGGFTRISRAKQNPRNYITPVLKYSCVEIRILTIQTCLEVSRAL